MRGKKYLLGAVVCVLVSLGVCNGAVAEKPKANRVMNRMMINGKVVLDTQDRRKIVELVQKNIGQTLIILPRTVYTGIWEQQPMKKNVKGKMISVIVNGKTVLDSSIPAKIVNAVRNNLGKRLVIKQRAQEYPDFSPGRMHVVVKGPYSKETLQDYLKKTISETNAQQKKNTVIKTWTKNEVDYYQYTTGYVISFSVQKTRDTRTREVVEMQQKDFILVRDNLVASKDIIMKMSDGQIKMIRRPGCVIFSIKSGKEVFEQVFKSARVFSHS